VREFIAVLLWKVFRYWCCWGASPSMTTRDDIALSTGHFVPCLLPVLSLSWILHWSPVLSKPSSQS